jgi:PKD repeat protein
MALLAPASAHAADQAVTLGESGFDKHEVLIYPGENVVFTNNSLLQAIQFEDETSTRCAPLSSEGCSRNFPEAGQYRFFASPQCDAYTTCAAEYRGVVIVDGPPSVGISGPSSGMRGTPVVFTAAATDPNGDTIASYDWNFGDGQFGTTATGSVQHTYSSAGGFTVSVTATDSRGNVSAPQSVTITIAVPDTDGDGFDDDHDQCALVPGVAPVGCVPLELAPPPLVASSVAPKTVGLNGTLRSGIAVVVQCSDACTGALSVVPLTVARRSVDLPAPYASGTVTIPGGGGSQLVTLRFTGVAKRALAKLKNPRLKLVVVLTDALGRVETRTSSIVLKTVKAKVGKLPAIGISDQQPTTFGDPLFQVLKLRYARLVTPWDAIFKEPERLDAWLQAARAQGVRPLVAFNHSRSNQCPGKPCKAPSRGQYTRAWKAFHRKYSWVKDISPWNEVNSATQPTGRRPDLAATYYNVVRANCRGCTIVAADVLDLNNMRRYLAAFLKKAKGKPRLWGLHNYRDTNRFRRTGTTQLLKAVSGQVWFTETGGIVEFTTQSGKKALRKSEPRAKKAMDYVFKLAALSPKRIERVYVYQWKVNFAGDRFDAGVVRPDGTPRPSFDVLTLNASIARKR